MKGENLFNSKTIYILFGFGKKLTYHKNFAILLYYYLNDNFYK